MPERRESQALVRAVLQERAGIQFLLERHESQALARVELPEPDEMLCGFPDAPPVQVGFLAVEPGDSSCEFQVAPLVLPEQHEFQAVELVRAGFQVWPPDETRSWFRV